MSTLRVQYDEEFKKNAVKLSYAIPKSVREVASDLGINEKRLYAWRRKYTAEGDKKLEEIMKSELTQIPGIGAKMAQHLINTGYPSIESLKGQDPEEIYTKHRLLQGPGNMSCKCVLYCYRLAVHYADNNGQLPLDKQNWENWKD